jgi:hypothetical protein
MNRTLVFPEPTKLRSIASEQPWGRSRQRKEKSAGPMLGSMKEVPRGERSRHDDTGVY